MRLRCNRKMPRISIVIPTYKHSGFIMQTLESVFAQTFTDYEVIVVNDGSPDDTSQVLRPLVETGRIHYIEQVNAGQAAARNRGIAEAHGEYIALLDDDDLWPPDKLQWQVEALTAYPDAALVYGYTQSFQADVSEASSKQGTFIGPSGDVHLLFSGHNFIASPGQTLLRARHLKAIQGFDATLWGVDDWDMYIRLAEQGAFLYYCKAALYYRLHAANASRDVWRMYCNARRMWIKHHGILPRPTKVRVWWRLRRSINELFFDDCAALAQQLASQGQQGQAREIWCAILSTRPGALRRRAIRRAALRLLLSLS